MECGAAEATGLGFVCFVVSTLVCSANWVDVGFFVHNFPISLSPGISWYNINPPGISYLNNRPTPVVHGCIDSDAVMIDSNMVAKVGVYTVGYVWLYGYMCLYMARWGGLYDSNQNGNKEMCSHTSLVKPELTNGVNFYYLHSDSPPCPPSSQQGRCGLQCSWSPDWKARLCEIGYLFVGVAV